MRYNRKLDFMAKKYGYQGFVESDLAAVKQRCADILSVDREGKKSDYVNYLLSGGGKFIRPVITLLSAALYGEVNSATISCAAVLELTHNASLIHDDVVDDAYLRRDRHSMNALWHSKRSVLVGDYVLSRAIRAALTDNIAYAIEDIAGVIEQMSMGEIEQIDATLKLDMTEERYYNVIRSKTAYLIGCAAKLGARSVGADSENCAVMEQLGQLIGMMFQITDDILDLTGSSTGKRLANDIKERKITLPLIYAFKRADKKESAKIMAILRSRKDANKDVADVVNFIVKNGGVDAARDRVAQFREEAMKILMSLDKSAAHDAMVEFIEHISNRER